MILDFVDNDLCKGIYIFFLVLNGFGQKEKQKKGEGGNHEIKFLTLVKFTFSHTLETFYLIRAPLENFLQTENGEINN